MLVNHNKNKERIQKFKETGNSRYIYRNELDKAFFQNDIAYEGFKDLPRRTASYNALRDEAFHMLEIQNMMDMIQRGLASTSYKFFVKKSASLTGKSA